MQAPSSPVPGGELGRRERKKQETRRALIEAAYRLASERGPDGVTVEEIADAADVSVRTFFNYFPGKEDAMVGMDPTVLDTVAAAVLERPAGEGPLDVLRVVLAPPGADMTRMADWWTRRIELLRAHPSLVARHLAGMALLERRLTEAVVERTGADDDDLYPGVVVAAAVAAFRLTLSRWDGTHPLQDDLHRAFDLLAGGLDRPARDELALSGP